MPRNEAFEECNDDLDKMNLNEIGSNDSIKMNLLHEYASSLKVDDRNKQSFGLIPIDGTNACPTTPASTSIPMDLHLTIYDY